MNAHLSRTFCYSLLKVFMLVICPRGNH
uniref:Uncharacterized protein n=1 Tax=Arundo donax TaxID=35708 RepID=A0A0A9FD99_ARUDO